MQPDMQPAMQPAMQSAMQPLSTLRLSVMRALYLLLAVGLGLTIWPSIIAPAQAVADVKTVVRALLGAIAVGALLGIRYPLQMLPVLLFELLWKVIWVFAFALPAWQHGNLDAYAAQTLFECLPALVLVPLAIPWGYFMQRYIRAPSDPWRHQRGA